MNRSDYFNYIEEKLQILAHRIEKRGKLNILDLHLHSENFYLSFFNKLFNWSLFNLNSVSQNIEAIDLKDDENKIVIQVSSTCTKNKVENALKKSIMAKLSAYNFKFISISKDASSLKVKKYSNPHGLLFNPNNDIYDISSILNIILTLEISQQKNIYTFIKDELGGDIDIVKLDSNLASIINILAKESLVENDDTNNINSFQIERKISHNNLIKTKYTIEEYAIHHHRVNKIYAEYDKQGGNKSISVLSSIRREYINNLSISSDDDLFLQIIENVKNKVLQSANFKEIPIDELELCIDILVVDAFIRCKIFKNPQDYNYVTP